MRKRALLTMRGRLRRRCPSSQHHFAKKQELVILGVDLGQGDPGPSQGDIFKPATRRQGKRDEAKSSFWSGMFIATDATASAKLQRSGMGSC